MAIDIAAVKAQFGSYYLSNPQNTQRLRSILYTPSVTASYFQDRPSEDTIYRATLSQLNRIVQPFQKAFTPLGTTKFTPNQFDLYKLKVDMEETPDDLESSYLGFLASQPEQDRSNWLFVRWLIETHIKAKIAEDLELNEYFTGVYAAPTAGTAGAAGTAMNGLKKVIAAYNTAGLTNMGNGAIATGALSTDNKTFVDQTEAMVDAIPELFRNRLDYLFMSPANVTKYKRGKRAKYNTNYAQASELLTIEDYDNISVVGLPSMAGSNLIFTTLADNRIRATKKAALANTLKLESNKRVVDILTDWWEALNFEVPQFVFHNDQGLV
jgi:hypothetical protein